MIVFETMLVPAATQAGIKVPPNLDDFKFEEFPHWVVFCNTQLARPMRHGEHWENAKTIAAIEEEKLKTMTYDDFRAIGVYPN